MDSLQNVKIYGHIFKGKECIKVTLTFERSQYIELDIGNHTANRHYSGKLDEIIDILKQDESYFSNGFNAAINKEDKELSSDINVHYSWMRLNPNKEELDGSGPWYLYYNECGGEVVPEYKVVSVKGCTKFEHFKDWIIVNARKVNEWKNAHYKKSDDTNISWEVKEYIKRIVEDGRILYTLEQVKYLIKDVEKEHAKLEGTNRKLHLTVDEEHFINIVSVYNGPTKREIVYAFLFMNNGNGSYRLLNPNEVVPNQGSIK